MKELSLYVLDIFNNSLTANSSLIRIIICIKQNRFSLKITDNGYGMSKDFLKRVTDPFVTTRTSRSVGMGLALLSQLMEQCEGTFSVRSKKDVGTSVFVSFDQNHIDAPPMGNLSESVAGMVSSLGQTTDLIYVYRTENGEFCLDTREMRRELGNEISLNEPGVFQWIKNYTADEIVKLTGENQ
jgi:hypothetical protein